MFPISVTDHFSYISGSKSDGWALAYHFWDDFEYFELTESMRQKDELDFYLFLNRIRIGLPSDADIKMLDNLKIKFKHESQKIKEAAIFFSELLKNGKSLIALFPKIKDVDEFNMQMSKINNIKLVKVQAEDDVLQKGPTRKLLNLKDSYNKKNKKTSETAGLDDILYIGENSRIILKRNLHSKKSVPLKAHLKRYSTS
jgi:hypothetical protein